MKRLVSLLLFTCLLTIQSCKNNRSQKDFKKHTGTVFGTTYTIIYDSEMSYQKSIDSLFTVFNNSLSTYIPNSIISRVNKNDTTVVVDSLFVEVFQKSKKIYKETSGYFDPTFGTLFDAYGFGSGQQSDTISKEYIASLMKNVGFGKIKINQNKVEKQRPNIQLNVNAIAKGFGIDIIGRFFEHNNINNYLVEIGGEIRAKGMSPRGDFWRASIDDPNTDGTRSQTFVVELNNESIASSGNYRKYRISKSGKKYVHTINPKTGEAVENDLLSVSVIANLDCADVDAYATALMAMGFEKSVMFLSKHSDLKAFLVYVDDKGNTKHYRSNNLLITNR